MILVRGVEVAEAARLLLARIAADVRASDRHAIEVSVVFTTTDGYATIPRVLGAPSATASVALKRASGAAFTTSAGCGTAPRAELVRHSLHNTGRIRKFTPDPGT